MTDSLWTTKLLAWLHDPAEKALILLRDREGHEHGTVARLRESILGNSRVPPDQLKLLKQADWWASAADRPQFPQSRWTQVTFVQDPVLTHPLSGDQVRVTEGFWDLAVDALKAISLDHFSNLVQPGDARKTALAFWRFGPQSPSEGDLAGLWDLLPADTRVPDHTIWTHLDVTSALAGAMASDPDQCPALLSVSLGPVQGFIAQARTTSDLWAGSHLLSYLTWSALKVVVRSLGPDAVLFPQLRGVPLVDQYLLEEEGLPRDLFEQEPFLRYTSDANPLFVAALPNRFTAIVPRAQAHELGEAIVVAVRDTCRDLAFKALQVVVRGPIEGHFAAGQIERQLEGFPEVYWSAAAWPTAWGDSEGLRTDLGQFCDDRIPFFDDPVYDLASREIDLEGERFYQPNPGTLYPAVYELSERAHTAAKSIRCFPQLEQTGERCSLCHEREWLTHDPELLHRYAGPRSKLDTIWSTLAEEFPSLARPGERLCAICCLKRMWPTLFCDALARPDWQVRRYMVSTHALAMSVDLEAWAATGRNQSSLDKLLCDFQVGPHDRAVLPRRLSRHLDSLPRRISELCRRLPLLADRMRDSVTPVPTEARRDLHRILGDGSPETYYGIIQLDGDRLGAWLSGEQAPTFRESLHPRVAKATELLVPNLKAYLDSTRAASPAQHAAISAALNAFSIHLVQTATEEDFKAKLLYAGGDDVLALVSVDDLPALAERLRCLYSGIDPEELATDLQGEFELGRLYSQTEAEPGPRARNGYVLQGGRLHRVMGTRATCSAGLVVAHSTAPLSWVLGRLREAEQIAKAGGRNGFCLRILKRGGSHTQWTSGWGAAPFSALGLLRQGAATVSRSQLSRRAMARSVAWLNQVPDINQLGNESLEALLHTNLSAQFSRQVRRDKTALQEFARLACAAAMHHGHDRGREPATWLSELLTATDFFARNRRGGVHD